MRIYIAGKITGDKHYKRKFRKAEKILRKKGHSPMSPAWLCESPEFCWHDYMTISRAMQDRCAATYFLPDWEDSKGAKEEYKHAKEIGQTIFFCINHVPWK